MELMFLILFVIGVLIHQRFFMGRPIVPTIVGVLSVSYIFNLILGEVTLPAQIVSTVGRKTREELE